MVKGVGARGACLAECKNCLGVPPVVAGRGRWRCSQGWRRCKGSPPQADITSALYPSGPKTSPPALLAPLAAVVCYHRRDRDTYRGFAVGQMCAVSADIFNGLPTGWRFSLSIHIHRNQTAFLFKSHAICGNLCTC